MASVLTIENTAGTSSFTINPGQLNGPGSDNRDTDLSFYGLGSVLWGQGVATAIYRLMENFACPDKGELLGGSPITILGVPQDEDDLERISRGISNPINGQLWFNTTNKSLYIYDGTVPGWVVQNVSANQNILLDALESVGCLSGPANSAQIALDLCDVFGYSIAAGTLYTDINSKLNLSGGTLTGDLTLSGPSHIGSPGLAATENYVDSVTNVGTSDRLTRTYSGSFVEDDAVPGDAEDGDIGISGVTAFVAIGGLWKQIY